MLTTGWEPDVPIGDTVLRRFVFGVAHAWEPAVRAMAGRVIRHDAFTLADLGHPAGFGNSVTLLQPLPPDPTPVLDEIEALLSDGTGAVALISAWLTPDLHHRGWQLLGHPPFHLRPVAPLPVAASPDGFEIRRVTDADSVRDFERVVVEGYPFPDVAPGGLVDERVLTATGPRLEVGYLDGRPVTAAARTVAHGLVHLLLGATLPEARHLGCWAAMVRSRLVDQPELPAVALFSDDSRPGAERLFGFLPISRFTLWLRPRP